MTLPRTPSTMDCVPSAITTNLMEVLPRQELRSIMWEESYLRIYSVGICTKRTVSHRLRFGGVDRNRIHVYCTECVDKRNLCPVGTSWHANGTSLWSQQRRCARLPN